MLDMQIDLSEGKPHLADPAAVLCMDSEPTALVQGAREQASW